MWLRTFFVFTLLTLALSALETQRKLREKAKAYDDMNQAFVDVGRQFPSPQESMTDEEYLELVNRRMRFAEYFPELAEIQEDLYA
ncbi:MAG: hypothetical protein HC828_21935 [Blastochloris sp.]|nr:hypothetical protein [Blastochloris sp.]